MFSPAVQLSTTVNGVAAFWASGAASRNRVKGNAQEQARLDKRSHMLKIHQRLGLITTALLIAALIVSNGPPVGPPAFCKTPKTFLSGLLNPTTLLYDR